MSRDLRAALTDTGRSRSRRAVSFTSEEVLARAPQRFEIADDPELVAELDRTRELVASQLLARRAQ